MTNKRMKAAAIVVGVLWICMVVGIVAVLFGVARWLFML